LLLVAEVEAPTTAAAVVLVGIYPLLADILVLELTPLLLALAVLLELVHRLKRDLDVMVSQAHVDLMYHLVVVLAQVRELSDGLEVQAAVVHKGELEALALRV
jgi:hypothetical protein